MPAEDSYVLVCSSPYIVCLRMLIRFSTCSPIDQAKNSFDEDILTPIDAPIDDLADLTSAEWDSLKEWSVIAAQSAFVLRLTSRYAFSGRFTSRQSTSSAATLVQSNDMVGRLSPSASGASFIDRDTCSTGVPSS